MNSLSTAGWPTTAQERMIYRRVAPHTLYAASIIQQSSLQIDRPSLDCQRHPCWTIGSSIQAASRRKAALSRRLTVGELRGSIKAQYELKRINMVYWDSYSPALPMRFIASLTFLITYVQKWCWSCQCIHWFVLSWQKDDPHAELALDSNVADIQKEVLPQSEPLEEKA